MPRRRRSRSTRATHIAFGKAVDSGNVQKIVTGLSENKKKRTDGTKTTENKTVTPKTSAETSTCLTSPAKPQTTTATSSAVPSVTAAKTTYASYGYTDFLDLKDDRECGSFDVDLSFEPDSQEEIMKLFKMSQERLMDYLEIRLRDAGYLPIVTKDYLYAEGTHPVLLVAHLDTVHSNPPHFIMRSEDNAIWSSPFGIGGDDRAGVYMVLQTIKRFNCSVLFTTDEEIGGLGARAFAQDYRSGYVHVDANYIIEYDRKGRNDAVFYNCGNDTFIDFVESVGFKEQYGSFSDISTIAPEIGIAAVNLSCGYYKPHTDGEYVVFPHLYESLERALILLGMEVVSPFKYIPAVTNYSEYGRKYSSYYGWDDTDYASWWSGKKSSASSGVSVGSLVVGETSYPMEDDEEEEDDGEFSPIEDYFHILEGNLRSDSGDMIENDGSYYIDLNGDLYQLDVIRNDYFMVPVSSVTPVDENGGIYTYPELESSNEGSGEWEIWARYM